MANSVRVEFEARPLEEVKFDKNTAKKVRINAGVSRMDLARILALDKNHMDSHIGARYIAHYETGVKIPKFKGRGDFASDYLILLMKEGYNPYDITLRHLQ